VNTGKISVKMTPWKSTKYLYQNKDFENYEFRSPVNPWKPQKKYMHEMDKIKFLEFDVQEGFILFIPPYWWYSIKYTSEHDTMVSSFSYNSVMNCVANIPDLAKYLLQQHNIKNRMTKTLELHEKIREESKQTEEENNEQENIQVHSESNVKKITEIPLTIP
jgi:hypothetical protein